VYAVRKPGKRTTGWSGRTAAGGLDADDTAVAHAEARHRGARPYRDAARTRGRSVRHRELVGVDEAVARNPPDRARAASVERRHEALRLGLVDHTHLDPLRPRDRELRGHLALAVGRRRDAETAHVAEPDRLAELLLQRADRPERALDQLRLLRRRA
jgi:hypothetical protein